MSDITHKINKTLFLALIYNFFLYPASSISFNKKLSSLAILKAPFLSCLILNCSQQPNFLATTRLFSIINTVCNVIWPS